MLAQTIIEDAYSEIRVLRQGYDLTGDEIQLGLRKLNRMLQFWSGSKNLLIPFRTRETLTLTDGVNSQTIGPTGDLVTARPTKIIVAKLKDGTTEYPLSIRDVDRFSRKIDRSYSSRPDLIYYEPTYPDGTLYFDSTIDLAYDLLLTSFKPLNTFADLVTNTDFPDEYDLLMVSNLAVLAAPDFGKEASQTTKDVASVTLLSIMANNQSHRVPELVVDAALLGRRRWNFDAGEFESG